MTKFEPLDAADSINQIHIEPIENGYLVKRYTMFSSAIIHCTLPDLLNVVASALPAKVIVPDASDYLTD